MPREALPLPPLPIRVALAAGQVLILTVSLTLSLSLTLIARTPPSNPNPNPNQVFAYSNHERSAIDVELLWACFLAMSHYFYDSFVRRVFAGKNR